MPTITKTVGSGGDFATLQEYLDDISSNAGGFYTAGDDAVCEPLENLTAGGPLGVLQPKNVTNGINSLLIRPPAGSEHLGIKGAGITLQATTASQTVISIPSNVDYEVTIQDLEIELAVTTGNSYGFCVNSAVSAIFPLIRRCIVHSNGYAGSGRNVGLFDSAQRIRVVRCWVSNFNNSGSGSGRGIWNCRDIINCTVDTVANQGVNAQSVTGGHNNISMGNGTDFAGTLSGTWDKNMSADLTAPGATAYPSETPALIWTDPGVDPSLLPGTNAIGTAEDMGATYEANIDITRQTVTGAWDLGAFQSGSPPPVIPPGEGVSGNRRLHTLGL